MRESILSFSSPLLAILIASPLLSSCNQTTPHKQTQAKQAQPAPRKVEKSVFDEWTDMRARRVPAGTKFHWLIYTSFVFSNEVWGLLEGKPDYPVCFDSQLGLIPLSTLAQGDWLDVTGKYLTVSSDGRVEIWIDELRNLGPG